jgi:hypothetical protein
MLVGTLLSVSATVACGGETGKHLFILSGQSNMVGMDPNQTFTPAVTKAFGAENVIVIKNAHAGCPIRYWHRNWKPAKEWKPETPGDEKHLETKADYFATLMKAVNASIRGEKIQSVTFIWMQGESDALQRHGAVYGESLRGLVAQLQKDLERSDIDIVIGRISDFGIQRKTPHWLMVRDAQVEFAESSPRYTWVDTDDLNDGIIRNDLEVPNDLHYSAEGYKLLGERFAQKAIALIAKTPDTDATVGRDDN